MSRVVASARDGEPLVAHVVTPPGCLARLAGTLRHWLVRLLVIGAAFACGYGCKAIGG